MASLDIPSIDFAQQPDPKDVSAASGNLGFLFIRNGGTPSQDLVEDMFVLSKQFFEGESLGEKEKVSITVQNQGWVRNKQEA
jgi:isopenicillin N synthase-like dioxygenase